ncbi:MAG TPA: hypothetical protein VMY99_03555 [Nevskiaceae bacterium]|nr:hypothetical protein [Nevskiaceae bacterium]
MTLKEFYGGVALLSAGASGALSVEAVIMNEQRPLAVVLGATAVTAAMTARSLMGSALESNPPAEQPTPQESTNNNPSPEAPFTPLVTDTDPQQ